MDPQFSESEFHHQVRHKLLIGLIGHTQEALGLLGKMIRLGRKQRKMAERELAERLDIARSTLQCMKRAIPGSKAG